jgi:hypothetical protein
MTQTRIGFWRSVCGCTVGSWSAVAAIVYCIIAPPLPASALWSRLAASVGIVLAAAIAGKLLALATARAVLAFSVRQAS